jgi:hypothetical protein
VLRHAKTLAIILLSASALFLTTHLWFNELSGSSLDSAMLMVLSRAHPDVDSGQNFFIKPARIVTSFGDNRYSIMYNDIDESEQKRNCDEAILLALDSGEYLSSMPMELGQLLAAPGYAYHYSAAMPSSSFVISYPQRRNALTSRVRNFEWVVVRPTGASGVVVVFFDTDGRAHEFLVDNSILQRNISDNIWNIAGDGQKLVYSYSQGFFVPQVNGFVYPTVVMENKYMDQGGLLLDYVGSKVEAFFIAGIKWTSAPAQVLTFSDENTVVKYFRYEPHNGLDVLEYANYRVIDQRIMTTLPADYNSAIRFISRDPTMRSNDEFYNEFYLVAAEETGNRRVFYFDYAINDLPISISDTGLAGQRHPIEIEVQNGVVTRYRKLVYNFVNSGELTADVSYEDVYMLSGLLMAGEQPEDLPLADVALRYMIDLGREMELYWFIELADGGGFSRSARFSD